MVGGAKCGEHTIHKYFSHMQVVMFSLKTANFFSFTFQAMSGCITFRDNPLEHEDQQRIMLDAISVTNETSYVPVGASDAVPTGESEGAADAISEDGGTPKVTPTSDKRVQKRPAPISPPEKKKTFRDQCMKRLVDAYEKKAQSSKQ